MRTSLSDVEAVSLSGLSGGVLTLAFERFEDGFLYLEIGVETPTYRGLGKGSCSISRLAAFFDDVSKLFVAGRKFAELSSTDLEANSSIEINVIDRRGTLAVHCKLTDHYGGSPLSLYDDGTPVALVEVLFATDQSYSGNFVSDGRKALSAVSQRIGERR